jgi:hypothetical protein
MSQIVKGGWTRAFLHPGWLALQRQRDHLGVTELRRLRLRPFSSSSTEPQAPSQGSGTTAPASFPGRASRKQSAWFWPAGIVIPSLALGGALVALHRDATFRAQVEKVLPGTSQWLSRLTGVQYELQDKRSDKEQLGSSRVERSFSPLRHSNSVIPSVGTTPAQLPATDSGSNTALLVSGELTPLDAANAERRPRAQLAENTLTDTEPATTTSSHPSEQATFPEHPHETALAEPLGLVVSPAEAENHHDGSVPITEAPEPTASSTVSSSSSAEVSTPKEMTQPWSSASSCAEIHALAEQLGTLVMLEALRIREIIQPLEDPGGSKGSGRQTADKRAQRRQVALALLEQEQTFRHDLERQLQWLQMALRRELEPQVQAQMQALFERAWSEHESSLRQQLREELETQRLVLKREQQDRLLEIQSLLERVEANALRDRAYKQYAHWAQRTALMWQALGERLSRGEPFSTELAAIREAWASLHSYAGAEQTTTTGWLRSAMLVERVLASLAPSTAAQGVTTAAALQERFLNQVFPSGRVAALMPDGSGVWGYWLARLAAWLKTSRLEENLDRVVATSVGSDAAASAENDAERTLTVEQRLVWARTWVERGDFRRAIKHLQQVPADSLVSRLCQDWMTEVEQYLMLEQAIRVIRAESSSITAALC